MEKIKLGVKKLRVGIQLSASWALYCLGIGLWKCGDWLLLRSDSIQGVSPNGPWGEIDWSVEPEWGEREEKR